MKPAFDTREFVSTYIRSLYTASVHEKFDTDDSWASEAVTLFAFEEPEKLIDVVLRVLESDPPEEILPLLAAGPLEDYLSYGGYAAINNLESLVTSNPSLRNLLGGVWQNAMPDDIWQRVQKIGDTTGWNKVNV